MIIAGGGTGGHLFPGVAVAEAFLKRDQRNRVLFIITGKPVEEQVLGMYGFERRVIAVEGITGRGIVKGLKAALKIPLALMQSRTLLAAYDPQVVLGVGGYVAGPLVFAARLMGYPTAIAEQNALPGLTNRILGQVVDRIFLSLPDNKGYFPRHKTLLTGNPIRASLVAEATARPQPGNEAVFNLLVFGGSQGAHVINQTMMGALDYLEGVKKELAITHQTGVADYEEVKAHYEAKGFHADVRPFITNMGEAYACAHLIVCRAGATTIAEVTALGKAAIFIPFARAVQDHQRENARLLVESQAAEMILERELSPEVLARTILRYHQDRPALARMAKRAEALGNPHAADDLVDALYALCHERKGGKKGYHDGA